MSWEKILKEEEVGIEPLEGLQEYIESNFDRRRGFEGRWWAKYQQADHIQKSIINGLYNVYKISMEGDAQSSARIVKAMKSVIKYVMEDINEEHEEEYDDARGEAEQERAGERAADSRRELQAERETEDRTFY